MKNYRQTAPQKQAAKLFLTQLPRLFRLLQPVVRPELRLHLYLFQDSSWTFHARCLINYESSSPQHYKEKKNVKSLPFSFTGSSLEKQRTAQTGEASLSRQLRVLRGATWISTLISNDFSPPSDYNIYGLAQKSHWKPLSINIDWVLKLHISILCDTECLDSQKCHLGVKRRTKKSFSAAKELHCVSIIITNCK